MTVASVMHFVDDPERAATWWATQIQGSVHVDAGFAWVESDGVELGFHPADEQKNPRGASTVVYWSVGDLEASRTRFIDAGCEPWRGPLALPGGRRICQLRDPFGIVFGLDQAPISITCVTGSESERRIEQQLRSLLDVTDTSRYWFTRDVVIEDGVIPHSHPVLTIGTRGYDDPNLLLADFIHEQLHWYLDSHDDACEAAIADLRTLYPDVPVGHPDGARDEHSTWLHLVLCPLEHDALVQLVGAGAASDVRRFWQADHYRWIYRTVESDWEQLVQVLERHGLMISR